MLEPGQVLWLILAALGLGVALPVMVQLFLTLRQARQTMKLLTEQVEPSLRLFNEIAQRPRDLQPGSQLATIIASLIPAIVAAYRAFRQNQADSDSAEIAPLENQQ